MSEEQNNGRPNRWWIGAAVIMVALLAAARGLSHTPGFMAWSLGHWYWFAGVTLIAATGYAAVRWLVSRAYRN
jgi:hypothetical protein